METPYLTATARQKRMGCVAAYLSRRIDLARRVLVRKLPMGRMSQVFASSAHPQQIRYIFRGPQKEVLQIYTGGIRAPRTVVVRQYTWGACAGRILISCVAQTFARVLCHSSCGENDPNEGPLQAVWSFLSARTRGVLRRTCGTYLLARTQVIFGGQNKGVPASGYLETQ